VEKVAQTYFLNAKSKNFPNGENSTNLVTLALSQRMAQCSDKAYVHGSDVIPVPCQQHFKKLDRFDKYKFLHLFPL
jgi:hypothetical protein